MPKSDLGDVCRRYLPSRLSKQTDSSLTNDQQSINSLRNNESINIEQKRQEISIEQLLYTPLNSTNTLEKMPANNDVLLTTFNTSTNTNGNGTNGNHSYRTTYVSCSSNSNGNGNHSSSPPSPSPSSSSSSSSYNDNSSLMMHWELLKDRGSGLVNLGNTCFINASLQCLANTPPLVQWILCNSHNEFCRVKLEKQFCLFCEAERIVKSMHSKPSNSSFSSSSAGAADPNNIVRRIRDVSTTFKVGRQEDASEFLICLIDKIVDACLRSSQPPERLRPSSGTSYEQLCHSQTIFHDLFGLVLRSRVDCSRCRQTSDTFEVQYAWIVSVRNQHDLRLSLEQFVSREILSGENLYRCMKCKQLVQAAKRYTLHKASKILLINLKRFEFGKNSHKLSHSVRYPEYLDVRPYMSEETVNDQSLTYRLYAVLVHIGSSMHSGHYFSFVRSPNNHWYKADDTTMTQCELNQVLNHSGAYILCYIKETSTPTTNGTSTSTTSKLVYQNGKPMTNSESTLIRTPTPKSVTMFTPRQVTVQNLPKQINGHNGCAKPVTPILNKPSIVTSTSESTNGNGTLSTVKREPIVMRIPNISHLSMSSVLQKKTIFASSSVTTPTTSKLVNKPNSTSLISSSSTMKNSNFTISSTTSLSSVQSTSSPLKLIIKTSGPSSGLNGLASICNSYNQNDDDDDDDDDDDHDNSSETVEPAKKKARVDDVSISSSTSTTADPLPPLASSSSSLSSTSPQPAPLPSSSSTQSNPTADEQMITSSTTKHKKKKKKKKSHKHHHHHRHHRHKNHHHRHHHRRSRHTTSRSRSRSLSYSPVGSPAYSNSSSSESTHRSHRKTKKHHRHKRSRSSTTSRSSRESL